MSEEVLETEGPTLLGTITQLVADVQRFSIVHETNSSQNVDTISPEDATNGSMKIIEAWDKVSSSFMMLNGFFDYVMAEHGLPTSGIVNLYELIPQEVDEAVLPEPTEDDSEVL